MDHNCNCQRRRQEAYNSTFSTHSSLSEVFPNHIVRITVDENGEEKIIMTPKKIMEEAEKGENKGRFYDPKYPNIPSF